MRSEAPRLYNELARYWPLISPREDYAHEAEHWRAALRQAGGGRRLDLLELGTGGGHFLSYLSREYNVTGVELSEGMLAHARKLMRAGEFVVADIRKVRLGRTFDAVLLHDALNHFHTAQDVHAVLTTAAAHLEAKGVLLLAPERYAETFQDGAASHSHCRKGDCEVAYFEYVYDPDPADTAVERVMVFVIREARGPVRIEEDRCTEGLFSREDWLRMLDAAGFELAEERRYDVDPAYPGLKLLVCTRKGGCLT